MVSFVSSFSTNQRTTVWAHGRLAAPGRPRLARPPGAQTDRALEFDFRVAAVQVGYWLGWASVTVVLGGLALDVGIRHRELLVAATLVAAAANTAAMIIPWRAWLGGTRGRLLLDLWCGGLIAFVAFLVVVGSSNFSLLLFLAVPFIAVVQVGRRRGIWLATSAATCAVAAALVPLSAAATAMRLGLVGAAVAVVLLLTRVIRRETAARRDAVERVELERTLAREANHRIKNDLQTAADLLLLARPDGAAGAAFDETASRIRSIATVHRLLTETEDRVDAGTLLRSITAAVPVAVTVQAAPLRLDAATAQKLGIVANELVTNAARHGAPPIVVRLESGPQTRLQVDDRGEGGCHGTGLGIDLVGRMVELGLDGRFELRPLPGGGTRAEVVFPSGAR